VASSGSTRRQEFARRNGKAGSAPSNEAAPRERTGSRQGVDAACWFGLSWREDDMIKKMRYGAKLAFAEFFVSCGIALRAWEHEAREAPPARRFHARGKVARSWVLPSSMHDRTATTRRITRSTTRTLHLRRHIATRQADASLASV
jgi:hypothetical protein